MKCKNETCSNEPTGSSAYCSNSCRAQHSRRNKTGAAQQTEAQHAGATEYVISLGDADVYGRTAVRFQGDQWLTRPSPLGLDDQPHAGGRGKYMRQDGSVYQFDSNGSAFEVTGGKVYQSTAEVKECYAK